MQKPRLLMMGGFLGAGKTTAMARAARSYLDRGCRVGLVTNDQSYDLVDTESLRAQGFDVGEVPGACFCCKFDDLISTLTRFASDQRPDVIIAEPVGSCTDLMATVVEPLCHLYADQFEIGPLAVLVKPEHGLKILRENDGGAGFSQKAGYIFLKQIEEADIVVVNKIDKLSELVRSELVGLIERRYPDKRILTASALTGDGFDEVMTALDEPIRAHAAALSIDYDIYAAGEAELCWLNCQATLKRESGEPFAIDQMVLDLVRRLAHRFTECAAAEPAHVKVMGIVDGSWALANLVSSEDGPELSCASDTSAASTELIINARVATDPKTLETVVRDALQQLSDEMDGGVAVATLHCFRPARPQPTHRILDREHR
ncbi:MAG: GTP-binding protein [Pirellulales bacterium]|nr:GTP-binding protein [Pirellulales bacterium]